VRSSPPRLSPALSRAPSPLLLLASPLSNHQRREAIYSRRVADDGKRRREVTETLPPLLLRLRSSVQRLSRATIDLGRPIEELAHGFIQEGNSFFFSSTNFECLFKKKSRLLEQNSRNPRPSVFEGHVLCASECHSIGKKQRLLFFIEQKIRVSSFNK